MFVRRADFAAVGGFAGLVLMADLDLGVSRRLRVRVRATRGRVALLPGPCTGPVSFTGVAPVVPVLRRLLPIVRAR